MTFSRRSRMLSIPLFEAASISMTLKELPEVISRHCRHSLHGSPSLGLLQLTVLASKRAVLVLPVPLGPEKPVLLVSLLKLLIRSEEHTSELQSRSDLVCRLLLEKKKQ